MKNIQKQYTDLLEGKMSKQNFMRNVRMEFPQHVTNVSSYEDTIKILKGKRIISEAAKPEGVYGHNPNAETPPVPGIDQLNYYQVYHGIQYELAQMPEITDENYIKARKKVVDTILKDPDAYKQLQLANFKAVKAMDEDLKMKEVKENNLTDKPNEMKVIKKDAKGNTEDTLGKKEKKKAKNPKGVQVMTQTPKKAKGIAKVMEVPAKEKTLKESTMLREEDLQQYAKKIADEHNLIMMPKPLDSAQLYQMWKKEKGSFGSKEGVMLYDPSMKAVSVLSSDKKVGEAVMARFIADRGGTPSADSKPFEEPESKTAYFKQFLIADVNEAKVRALKENIMQEMTLQNPTYEHFQVGARVKKKDNSLVGEITEWDGDTATVKTDEGEIHHVQGNILTKGDIPAKEDTPTVNPKAHVPEDVEKVAEATPTDSHNIKADQAIDQSELKFLKNAFAKVSADQIPEKYKKIIADLEAKLSTEGEQRDAKLKSLKEKLMNVVKEVSKVTDDKGTVVALKANAADAQEFVQGQEPAVKSKLKVTA